MKPLTSKMLGGAILFAALFSSCGEDEPSNPARPSEPAKPTCESVAVGYDVKLSEAYYQFYDVKVVFTDGEGNLMNGPLTADQNFGYTIPAAKLPENIRFAIQATAKNPLPGVEEGRTYTFSNNSSMTVVASMSDGTKETSNLNSTYYEYEVEAGNVAAFIANEPELLIGPYEFSTTSLKK